MKPIPFLIAVLVAAQCATAVPTQEPPRADPIDLLGQGNLDGWRSVRGGPVNQKWELRDGVLYRGGILPGDIVTTESFGDFDLRFEFRISEGGNSGIKYRTRGSLGLEYQILDDERHPDGKIPSHRVGSLYDLYPASDDKPVRPVGEWNEGRIVVRGTRIEHWLNGSLVVDAEIGSAEWEQRFAASKYRKHEGFGTWNGPILLQDHRDEVWFRNLRLTPLPN